MKQFTFNVCVIVLLVANLATGLASLKLEAMRYAEMRAVSKVIDGVFKWPWKRSER